MKKINFALLFLIIILSQISFQNNILAQTPHSQWSISSSTKEAKVGDIVEIIYNVSIEDDWYLYGSNFGEGGPQITSIKAKKDTVRQGQPTIFSGLISIAGAINVQDMGDSQGLRNYCGVRSSQMFADANILDKLQDKETLPFFCMHGSKDVLVNYQSSVNFVEMLKLRQNENVSLVSLPDYGHMKTCFTWYTNPILFNKILEWIFEQEKLQISQMSN